MSRNVSSTGQPNSGRRSQFYCVQANKFNHQGNLWALGDPDRREQPCETLLNSMFPKIIVIKNCTNMLIFGTPLPLITLWP
jgi:hypothetical protein